MGNPTTLSGHAGARVGMCQRMTEDTEQFTTPTKMTDKEMATQEFDVVRSKVFNIHKSDQ